MLGWHYWVVTWRVKHWVQRTRKEETEFQKLGQVSRHEERGIWGQMLSKVMEDSLEEGMATHSSILAWGIPWTEECGGLQSIGSHRVGHD